ncbi:MAG: uncharacterized protein PWQ11_111 [Candidatus Diapherotrites archaeon]|nr:uncharacterized protein [Candidatus Diapherotrites archaeon]
MFINMNFRFKLYRTPEATVLAVCDSELLGRVFREGEVVLNVSRSYYGGEEADAGRLRELLAEADIVSLVGEGCISVAVDMGLAEWRFVKRVEGVPHLNVYRL